MQNRVLFRTAKKVGLFLLWTACLIGSMFGSALAGHYFFNDPFIGNMIVIGLGSIIGISYFSYREAKTEIEFENNKLIQELTKHG